MGVTYVHVEDRRMRRGGPSALPSGAQGRAHARGAEQHHREAQRAQRQGGQRGAGARHVHDGERGKKVRHR